MSIQTDAEDIVALQSRLSNLIAVSDEPIADEHALQSVAAHLAEVKRLQKDAADARSERTRPLEERKKGIIAWFKTTLEEPLEKAERALKGRIAAYNAEQERQRQKAQAIADELARKEREKLAKRAAAAEAKGQDEKAAALAMQAESIVAPTMPAAPKASGVTKRTVWKFRITDASLVPNEYKMVDETKVGAVVRATKGSLQIPGIEIYSEDSYAAAAS